MHNKSIISFRCFHFSSSDWGLFDCLRCRFAESDRSTGPVSEWKIVFSASNNGSHYYSAPHVYVPSSTKSTPHGSAAYRVCAPVDLLYREVERLQLLGSTIRLRLIVFGQESQASKGRKSVWVCLVVSGCAGGRGFSQIFSFGLDSCMDLTVCLIQKHFCFNLTCATCADTQKTWWWCGG